MKGNIHKKETLEDKFARYWYCEHARLNLLRFQKRHNNRKFRKISKSEIQTELRQI